MYCYYKWSVAFPHGAVGWSAVFDCGISWSYSLSFVYVVVEPIFQLLKDGKILNVFTTQMRFESIFNVM